MRSSDVKRPPKHSKLYAQTLALASHGKHPPTRKLVRAEDEAAVKVLQERVRLIEFATILGAFHDDDDEDLPEQTCAVDTISASHWLWILYWSDFL